MIQAQVVRLDATSLLMKSLQLNHLIGHETEGSELSATAEDLDLEDEDG